MPFDLHDLKIDEVSFCKKGKNKGAKVALYKAENNEEVVKALFNEILAGMELNESVSKAIDKLFQMEGALRESIFQISNDREAYPNPKESMRASLNQFIDAASTVLEDIPDEIEKADIDSHINKTQDGNIVQTWTVLNKSKHVSKTALIGGTNFSKEYSIMNEENKTPTAEEQIKKAVEEQLAPYKQENEILKAVAEMTDNEKAFYKSLTSDEQKEEFRKASSEDRQKQIEKSKQSDEVLELSSGAIIRKADVGDSVFDVMKAQNKQMAEMQTQLTKAQEDQKQAFEKAEFQTLINKAEKEYPYIPGTPEEKAKTLQAIKALPEDQQEVMYQNLKKQNEALASGFSSLGSTGMDTEDDPNAKLEKMAQKHAEEKGIDFHKAYNEVIQTDEGRKLNKEISKSVRTVA